MSLVEVLIYIADQHHRTIEGSKLHNPEENINFFDCNCLTCVRVTRELEIHGYNRDYILKFLTKAAEA